MKSGPSHKKFLGKIASTLRGLPRIFSKINKSEVAEALIATWCIEFLRVRKIGGFNVIEIVVISAVMLGVKAMVIEASRRRYSDKERTFVMPPGSARVEPMVFGDYSSRTHKRRSHSPLNL